MAKKSNAELEAENEQLRAQLDAMKKESDAREADDAEVNERIRISGGALSRDEARQVVANQRAWEAHPEHPDNIAKAKAAATVATPEAPTNDSTPKA